jgi:hypothetical protein
MKQPEFVPKKSIDQRLENNPFNQNIVNRLANKRNYWYGTFDPLQFLNVFYETLEVIRLNKDNSGIIIEYIKNLNLDKKQLYCLTTYLLILIRNKHSGDDAMMNCRQAIKDKLYLPLEYDYVQNEHLNFKIEELSKPNVRFLSPIEAIKNKLDDYHTCSEKLSYLINCKHDRTQEIKNTSDIKNDALLEDISLEIERYSELKLVEQGGDNKRSEQDDADPIGPEIIFDEDIKTELRNWFKDLIPSDRMDDLDTLLQGGRINKKIHFNDRQCRLAGQFFYLKHASKIDPSIKSKNITAWLCDYFKYRNKKGNYQDLSYDTVKRGVGSGYGTPNRECEYIESIWHKRKTISKI